MFKLEADYPMSRVILATDGKVVSGRDDAWYLIGFQNDIDVQTVNLFWDDARNTPDHAAGKFPVFSSANGSGMFVVTIPVRSLEPLTL